MRALLIKTIVAYSTVVCCVACISATTTGISAPSAIQQPGNKPYWYYKPDTAGKIGGVGICGQHINGQTGQRELAVERALEDIARQMGVKVSSSVHMLTEGTKDSADTHVAVYSVQTVEGKTVKAAVREFWEDARTGELYVWMVVQ